MYESSPGQLTGLDIEFARAITAISHCPITFTEIPFKRHLAELKRGKIDLATSTQYTRERAEYARYSIPYRTSRTSLIIRPGELDRFPFKTLDDLAQSNIILGITRGYFYGDKMKSIIENPQGSLNIEDVISVDLNLLKLSAKRIDAFLADPVVISNTAKAINMVNAFEIHPMPVYATTFHVIASKQAVSEETFALINEAIQQLEDNGELEALIARYMQE